MCCDPATVVMPSATSPASTRAAPARMSLASTGAPGEPLDAADHDVVAVDAGLGAEPDELLDRAEPGLEDVLGDHRRAVGDRVAAPARTAAGRSGSPGRAASRRRRPAAAGAPSTRKPLGRSVDGRPAGLDQLSRARRRGGGRRRRRPSTSPRVGGGGEGPGAGDDAVGDDGVLDRRSGCRRPCTSIDRGARPARSARPSR